MHRFGMCVIVIVLSASSDLVRAQTPGEIGHQGILTDSLGNPFVEGSFQLTFSLYDQATGGSVLWTEQQTVSVEEGLFTALLGSVNPINLAFDQPYWLSVRVDGDELDPRLRFTASPYSRRAAAVDSVGPEAIGLGSVPVNRLDPGGAPASSVLAVVDTDSAGWTFIQSANIWPKSILNTRMSPQGGGSGQILTVQGDSVVWASPPEITGAAIPDKSVRSIKLNSEDGEIGLVMLAGDNDTVVWSQLGSAGIADDAVTSSKISPLGGAEGEFLVTRGDSVDWADATALNAASIPPSKLSHVDVTAWRVMLLTDADTAGWGLVSNPSIANRGVSAVKVNTAGGVTGQVLTVDGPDAVWSDPAGLGKGTVLFDRLSAEGGAQGDVLQVVDGDTVGWDAITAANIASGSVTPSRMNVSGASDGQVLQVSGGSAGWNTINGTVIASESIPIGKIDPSSATSGNILTYNGADIIWAPDGVKLPFKGSVTASDSVGIRVSSPSVLEGSGFAIQGIMTSQNGGAFASAIRGENRSTSALGVGVWGSHEGGGWGVYGRSTSGRGVYGSSPDGFAGYFSGNVRVTGSIEKAGGSFKIDHPLDPENRYLLHSFVESPDMMNVYNGNVTLNGAGEAVVTMPDWFEALNSDYRYQLTPIGAPGPNLHVAQEIQGNAFRIGGGSPGMRVSWQVTGVRNDPWARQNRIPVEEIKQGTDRGTYLHPEAFGVSPNLGLEAQDQEPGR